MNYNIEFAHIYTDEEFGINHIRSIEQLQDFASLDGLQYSSIVLIDNYNASTKGFSTKDFISELRSRGATPDFYAYERDLKDLADELLDCIEKPKIKRLYKSYLDRKKKYPCSLMTAAWYLARLGAIDGSHVIRVHNKAQFTNFVPSKRIINILPKDFIGVEKEAHRLIGHSKYSDYRYKIQPILFSDSAPIRVNTSRPAPELVSL